MGGRLHIAVVGIDIEAKHDILVIEIYVHIGERENFREGIGVAALVEAVINEELCNLSAAAVEFSELRGDVFKVFDYIGFLADVEANSRSLVPQLVRELESLFLLIVLDIAQIITSRAQGDKKAPHA